LHKQQQTTPRGAEMKFEAGGETLSVKHKHRPILCPRRDATLQVCQRGLEKLMGLFVCIFQLLTNSDKINEGTRTNETQCQLTKVDNIHKDI